MERLLQEGQLVFTPDHTTMEDEYSPELCRRTSSMDHTGVLYKIQKEATKRIPHLAHHMSSIDNIERMITGQECSVNKLISVMRKQIKTLKFDLCPKCHPIANDQRNSQFNTPRASGVAVNRNFADARDGNYNRQGYDPRSVPPQNNGK